MKQDHTKLQVEIPQMWAQKEYLDVYFHLSSYLSTIYTFIATSELQSI